MPIQATLKNVIIGGALLGMAHGMSVEANEDKITKGFYTMDVKHVSETMVANKPRDMW